MLCEGVSLPRHNRQVPAQSCQQCCYSLRREEKQKHLLSQTSQLGKTSKALNISFTGRRLHLQYVNVSKNHLLASKQRDFLPHHICNQVILVQLTSRSMQGYNTSRNVQRNAMPPASPPVQVRAWRDAAAVPMTSQSVRGRAGRSCSSMYQHLTDTYGAQTPTAQAACWHPTSFHLSCWRYAVCLCYLPSLGMLLAIPKGTKPFTDGEWRHREIKD